MSEKPTEGLKTTVRIGGFDLTALENCQFTIQDETWSAFLAYLYIHSDEAQKKLDTQALSKVLPSAEFIFTLPDGKQYSGIGRATSVEVFSSSNEIIKKFAIIAGEGCLTITD